MTSRICQNVLAGTVLGAALAFAGVAAADGGPGDDFIGAFGKDGAMERSAGSDALDTRVDGALSGCDDAGRSVLAIGGPHGDDGPCARELQGGLE